MSVIRTALRRAVAGEHMERGEAREVMERIMAGEAEDAQIAALLTALRMKGETVAEVAGMAEGMRQAAVRITSRRSGLTDTCGTGGDGRGTFNVSTTAALIAAGAGLPIAKHGNRGVSSACGSADVLQALGVRIEMPPAATRQCLDEVGIGFLFAPAFHPAMRHVMPARRAMGIPTVFNILGPLSNPAGAARQLLGASDPRIAELLAEALTILGCERALVVHGDDGMDEVTLCGETTLYRVEDGAVTISKLDPRDLGLQTVDAASLAGGTPEVNARIIVDILEGRPGPRRESACLNAAMALVAGGLVDSPQQGLHAAYEAVDSGAAFGKLEALRAFSAVDA
ncbi:MAG: anthranilate phosphoribosyltransferase [Candidatus Geothermincolia bacterium]